jgi:hypothetical protein
MLRLRSKLTHNIIGTPAVTTRGFGEKECRELASMMCDICDELDNKSVIDSVRTKVAMLCASHPVYNRLVFFSKTLNFIVINFSCFKI